MGVEMQQAPGQPDITYTIAVDERSTVLREPYKFAWLNAYSRTDPSNQIEGEPGELPRNAIFLLRFSSLVIAL